MHRFEGIREEPDKLLIKRAVSGLLDTAACKSLPQNHLQDTGA